MAFLNKSPLQTPVLLAPKSDLYWKPRRLSADLLGGVLEVTLGIWEAREAAQIDEGGNLVRQPLLNMAVRATVAEFPQLQKIIGSLSQGKDDNAKKLLYGLLGSHPDLSAFGLESDEK